MEEPAEDPLGHRSKGNQEAPRLGRGRDRPKIAKLFADEQCKKAILDFLATIDVGKTAGPRVVEVVEAGGEAARPRSRRAQGTPRTDCGGRGEVGRGEVGSICFSLFVFFLFGHLRAGSGREAST